MGVGSPGRRSYRGRLWGVRLPCSLLGCGEVSGVFEILRNSLVSKNRKGGNDVPVRHSLWALCDGLDSRGVHC
jgi:hypothetical protein